VRKTYFHRVRLTGSPATTRAETQLRSIAGGGRKGLVDHKHLDWSLSGL